MKKWYSIGLLVIAMILAASFLAACGGDDTTETTVADETATTVADETATTAAEGTSAVPEGVDTNTIGIYIIDTGNNTLAIWDVPAPGMAFPVHTATEQDDEFAMVITVLDASGAVLGELETVGGTVDYSAYADTAAKVTVTNKAGEVVATYDIM